MKNLIILLVFATFHLDGIAQQEKRLALVIGNGAYEHGGVLKNPVNDANLMASTLQGLGFTVIKRTNADKSSMERAIYEFSRGLANNDVGLFYYAGHGIQIEGTNYLIPINAHMNDKIAVRFEGVSVNEVVEQFEYYPDKIKEHKNIPHLEWRGKDINHFRKSIGWSKKLLAQSMGYYPMTINHQTGTTRAAIGYAAALAGHALPANCCQSGKMRPSRRNAASRIFASQLRDRVQSAVTREAMSTTLRIGEATKVLSMLK